MKDVLKCTETRAGSYIKINMDLVYIHFTGAKKYNVIIMNNRLIIKHLLSNYLKNWNLTFTNMHYNIRK